MRPQEHHLRRFASHRGGRQDLVQRAARKPHKVENAKSAATQVGRKRQPPSDRVEEIDDQLDPDDENDLRSDQLEIFDQARIAGFIDQVNKQGRSEAKSDQLFACA